jgi:Cdc6-like AAA superfamily ATPase
MPKVAKSVIPTQTGFLTNPAVSKILSDPVFTPGLKQRITDVADLNADFNDFLDGVIRGVHRSAVVYGPPGLGKTHTVTSALAKAGKIENTDYVIVRSHATPLQLYQILYFMRQAGKTVVLDDCDGVLTNEVGLNIIKGATDNKFRQVGWHSSVSIKSPSGKNIPSSFVFDGSLLVVTNVRLAQGKGRMSNHWDALRSRMPGFHLALDDRSDQYAQIFYAITELDYLSASPETILDEKQKITLLKFFLDNLDLPRRLDLRMPEAIAREMKSRPENWERRARRILESA